MRTVVLTAFLMGAWAAAAEAQTSSKAVVDAGPPPSANYVWVAINGGGANANSVVLRNPNGSPVLDFIGNPVILTGAPFNFNRPWDIVGSPLNHRVFVSNNQGAQGTVTVIDSDTLQWIQTVTIPGSVNLRGMSVSEDESAVFVAGADVNGPAVFEIDTVTLA